MRIPLHQTAQKSVGTYLLDALLQRGVEHIFGIPGDYIIRFDKLIENHPIRFINTTRESTAGAMADAYARLKGLGVACITYGVGMNIVNALAQAYTEGVPLVVISGAHGKDEYEKCPYRHHLINKSVACHRDTTQLEIFSQVTCDQAVLTDPLEAPKQIFRVLESALREKKPVYLELPRDLVDAPISLSNGFPLPEEHSDPEALKEAVGDSIRLFENAQKPLLWIGREAHVHGLTESLLAFAEAHRIPIVSTLLGKGGIDERHPLYLGVFQGKISQEQIQKAFAESDLILMAGVLRTDVDTGFFSAEPETSHTIVASPRRIAVGRHHYPDVLFEEFLQALSKAPLPKTYEPRAASFSSTQKPFTAKEGRLRTARLLACLQKHLKPQHILAADTGDALFASSDLIVGKDGYLAGAYFASMGYAVPAAIGAAVAEPERRVIALVGDGSFQMTGTELTTALRYGLDPIIIVLNNHGYATERPLIEGEFNDIVNWNYAGMPALLGGGIGVRAETEKQFEEALISALKRRGAFHLIEADLEKLDFSPALKRFEVLAKKTV